CAFEDCSSLTSITIPNSVTSIGDFAFEDCSSLTSITVDLNNQNYSSQDGVLFNKDKTTLIQHPIGNTRTSYAIPSSVTSIGNSAFSGCNSLTSVTIPSSVVSIGYGAFGACGSLNKVNVNSIEAWCKISFLGEVSNPLYFAHNLYIDDNLVTDLIIPNSVTSISSSAFEYCLSLKSVTIPDSVTNIGNYAFSVCYNITDVYYSGSIEQWSNIRIGSNNKWLTDAYKHYNYLPYSSGGDDITQASDNQQADGIINENKATEPSAETTTIPITQPIAQNTQATQATTTTTPAKAVKKPKSTSIKKLTKGKKSFKITFKKVTGIDGYQVQYATDKKFKKNKKSVTVKKSKTSATVKNLKANKKYYVRVRTYKTVNGKKVYSSWSKVKSIKTK
ncbi:MAG: fibronectin type III domain-containing protein, partial [Eubacterium sp.]